MGNSYKPRSCPTWQEMIFILILLAFVAYYASNMRPPKKQEKELNKQKAPAATSAYWCFFLFRQT